jgi:predicted DNA-binding protein
VPSNLNQAAWQRRGRLPKVAPEGWHVFSPFAFSLFKVSSFPIDAFKDVVHIWHMSTTLSIRLPDELARWVEEKSQASGRSKGSLVKEALELIQVKEAKPFMRLAGKVKGASDLSSRKGFSKA